MSAEIALCLEHIGSWSYTHLSQLIAYECAGLTTRFDVIETLYAALICKKQYKNSQEVSQMVKHATNLILDKYLHQGCLRPSSPVLADRKNYSLQCPTVEPLSLLIAITPESCINEWPKLMEVADWLTSHFQPENGWCSETDGNHGKPTPWMTASSLAFLALLERLLDAVLALKAAEELKVPPCGYDDFLKDYKYPNTLSDIIPNYIVKPLTTDCTNSKFACYSMILTGPPGTSKTTIAKKLAQDLEWPLLIINQSDFLRNGLDRLDSEADRIFGLAALLKKTVILFDEVEELVESREGGDKKEVSPPEKYSRLLTTSMLPRIHRLRDLKQVVFIFATNRLESIDKAAARLGRFDIIKCVMPPNDEERYNILNSILHKYDATEEEKQLFLSESLAMKLFCYPELDSLVKMIIGARRIKNDTVSKDAITLAIEKSHINKAAIQEYETRTKNSERP